MYHEVTQDGGNSMVGLAAVAGLGAAALGTGLLAVSEPEAFGLVPETIGAVGGAAIKATSLINPLVIAGGGIAAAAYLYKHRKDRKMGPNSYNNDTDWNDYWKTQPEHGVIINDEHDPRHNFTGRMNKRGSIIHDPDANNKVIKPGVKNNTTKAPVKPYVKHTSPTAVPTYNFKPNPEFYDQRFKQVSDFPKLFSRIKLDHLGPEFIPEDVLKGKSIVDGLRTAINHLQDGKYQYAIIGGNTPPDSTQREQFMEKTTNEFTVFDGLNNPPNTWDGSNEFVHESYSGVNSEQYDGPYHRYARLSLNYRKLSPSVRKAVLLRWLQVYDAKGIPLEKDWYNWDNYGSVITPMNHKDKEIAMEFIKDMSDIFVRHKGTPFNNPFGDTGMINLDESGNQTLAEQVDNRKSFAQQYIQKTGSVVTPILNTDLLDVDEYVSAMQKKNSGDIYIDGTRMIDVHSRGHSISYAVGNITRYTPANSKAYDLAKPLNKDPKYIGKFIFPKVYEYIDKAHRTDYTQNDLSHDSIERPYASYNMPRAKPGVALAVSNAYADALDAGPKVLGQQAPSIGFKVPRRK